MPQWSLSHIRQKCTGVPSVLEIVWGPRRPKRRILDADNFLRRRQNSVRTADWGTQDNVAALLSVGEIDFEAREGGAGQSAVGEAGPHDLPERSAVTIRNGGLRGERERDATYGGYSRQAPPPSRLVDRAQALCAGR